MSTMNEKYNNCICWVDNKAMIFSFHAVAEFERKQFNTRKDMMEFVVSAAETGYRIQ